MEKVYKNCQSCGMPMKRDKLGGGTHADGSKSTMYCSHCFQSGRFARADITTAEQMQELVKAKLKEMGFPGFLAGMFTRGIPRLERWKSSNSARAVVLALLVAAASAGLSSCSSHPSASLQTTIDSLRTELTVLAAANARVQAQLAVFDTLDFDVFSHQKWDRLGESHAQDILVHWPDGHTTEGLATHVEDLKAMFVYAPDTKIAEHPIRFGSGEWTAVTGTMTGTFSQPMPIGGGKFIQPTGKQYSVPMATIGRWENGLMKEEYLFWDNQTFMKQLGLAK